MTHPTHVFRLKPISIIGFALIWLAANALGVDQAPALAQGGGPVASVTLNVPGSVLIGSTFSFSATFDNTAANAPGNTGYGPFIDLYFPWTGADGDDGLSFVSATYLGASVTVTELTFPGPGPTGCVNHPYAIAPVTGAPLQVCGPSGDRLVVVQLPFGSFTPDQPAAAITVNATLSSLADASTPLTLRARAGYQFGATPLQDWCCPPFDATILSQTSTDGTTWSPSAPVTPTLITVSKTYNGPEDETATGSNYPRRYTITADIANGQTLTTFVLTDSLPSNMQFVQLIAPTTPAGAACSTPSTSTPGGNVACTFASVTGGAGASDAAFTFEFYLPLNNAGGSPVINAASGDDAQSLNNASASGTWDPTDPRDPLTPVSVDGVGPEHTLTDKSIAIQKGVAIVSNVGPAGNSPGDTLEYTLSVQVSDFFAFQGVVITDVMSDGQRFDLSFTPTLSVNGNTYTLTTASFNAANYTVDTSQIGNDPNPATDGSTTLTFRVSDEIITRGQDGRLVGGCIPATGTGGPAPNCSTYDDGATTAIVRFRAVIQDQFSDTYPSGDQSVDHGDVLNNSVTTSGGLLTVANTSTPTGQTEADTSGASVTIQFGTLAKTVFAINGSTTFTSPVQVSPGDTITYRLRYSLPTSDFETLTITDYLPLPVLYASEITSLDDVGGSGNPLVIPAAGRANFGPADTFRALAGNGVGCPIASGATGDGTPCLSIDASSNSLSFSYGNFDDPANTDTEIDLLFTVTVSDDPFADGLLLTNQARAREGTTNAGDQNLDGIIQITLTEPALVFDKSVIATSNPGAVYAPTLPSSVTFNAPGTVGARWSGNLNSTVLANEGLNSDVTGVEAGDLVSFALVIENQGLSAQGAFDIDIRDTLPAGFSIPAGGLNLRIAYGDNSSTLAFTRPDGSAATANDLFTTGLRLVDPGGATGGACQVHSFTSGLNVIVITYDLQVNNDVAPNQAIVNTGTLFNYAGAEGGPDFTTNDLTDEAEVTIRQPALNKLLAGTEINTAVNGNTQAVVGEFLTYTLTLTVPQGVSPNAVITDVMDSGLAFVDLQSVAVSPGLTVSNTIGTGANPANVTIGGTGNQLVFNLGTITNTDTVNTTDETIVFNYRAVALNVSGNQGGTLLNNAASFAWGITDTVAPITPTANVSVIEPALTIGKTASPTTGDAGDTITFDITITNPVTSTDAFDVVLTDTLPAGLTFAGTLTNLSGNAPTTLIQAGGTITATWSSFPANTNSVIRFTATLSSSVTPGQTITNNATTAWTSLSGSPGQRSIHNPSSTERTGAGGVNDYVTSGSRNVTVTSLSASKTIVTTSEAHTSEAGTGTSGSPRLLAVGEIIRYRLVLQVPEGTAYDLQLRDQFTANGGELTFLDDGSTRVLFVADTGFVSSDYGSGGGLVSGIACAPLAGTFTLAQAADPASIPSASVNCTPADNNISSSESADNDTYNGNTPVYVKVGTITNTDNDANAEFVIVEFNALADNASGATSNDAGDTPTDTLQGRRRSTVGGGLGNNGGSSARTVRIVEPSITNTLKTATPTTGDAGDTIAFRITYSNAGGANNTTAFEARITDTLPAAYALNLGSVTVTLGGGASGVTDNSAGNTVDVTIATVPASATVQIDYTATVLSSVTPGQAITNTANLTYTGLPGTNGTLGNATGSNTPGAGGTSTGERNGSGTAPNDYLGSDPAAVTITNVAPVKSLAATSEASTGGSDLAIGEIVRYRLAVDLPEGTSDNFQMVDTLPSGLTFIDNGTGAARVSFLADNAMTVPVDLAGADNDALPPTFDLPAGRIVAAGQTITFTLGNLVNNDSDVNAETVVIEFNALVNNTANNNNTDLKNNVFEVFINGASRGTSNTVTATVREPALTMNKSVTPTTGDAGDTITYTVTLTNTGATTAFDARFTDTLPSTLLLNLASLNATSAGNCAAGLDGSNSSGNTVDGRADSLPGGCVVTLTYAAEILSTVAPGQVITNTAQGTYTSLPGTGTASNPTGSFTPGVSGASDGERNGSGGVNDYAASDSAALTVTGDALSKALESTSENSTAGSSVTIGEIITYTLTITLPEGSTPSLVVTDTLPAGLQYVSGSASVDTSSFNGSVPAPAITAPGGNGDDVTLTFGLITVANDNLPGNNAFRIRLQARVLDVPGNAGVNPPGQTTLPNAAAMQAGTAPVVTSNTVTATVVEPRLAVSKSIAPDPASPNDVVTVTLTVSNTGTSTAFDVIVDDPLLNSQFTTITEGSTPPGFTFGTVTAGATTTVRYTGGDIPAGNSATFTFTATLASTLSNGTLITNTAAATQATTLPGSDANERDEPDASGSDTLTIITPDLQLAKDDGLANVVPGQIITYTLAVTNTGQAAAAGVVITETVPTNTTFNATASAPSAWSCADASPGGMICTTNLGTVAASASTSATFAVTVLPAVPANATAITNTATVADDGANGSDPTPINNTDGDVDTLTAARDLVINKTDSGVSATPGQAITYTLTYTNTGNRQATGVVITETVPANTTFNAAASAPSAWSCADGSPAGTTCTITLGSLNGGTGGAQTFAVDVVTPLPAGVTTLTNTTSIGDDGASGADPTPGDNTSTETTPVNAAPDLVIAKTDGGVSRAAGQVITYTLTYTNAGNQNAAGVVVTETVPANATFNAAASAPSAWSCANGSPAGTSCTIAIGNLNAGAGGTLTFAVNIVAPLPAGVTTLTNTTSIADDGGNGPEPTPSDNSSTDTTPVNLPAIELTKSVTPGSAARNQPITYTLLITNTGAVTFDPLALTDTLPAGFNFVTGSGTPSDPNVIATPALVWSNLGPLAPGNTLTVTFAVTANPGTLGTFINNAEVAGTTPGGVLTDTASAPIVLADPAVAVDKQLVSADTDLIAPNFVTFTIRITNTGPSLIDVLPLVDLYDPANLAFVSATPAPDDNVDDGQLTWSDLTQPAPNGFGADLPPGQSVLITTVFRVVQDITSTTNTALVTGALDAFTNPASDVSDAVVIVNVPTSVELLYFRIGSVNGQPVTLEWATASEVNNFGFKLYRGSSDDFSQATEIVFVPAAGSGANGATYSYLDDAPAEGLWWYWLVDVSTTGQETRRGPVTTALGQTALSNKIYLPVIGR